MSLELHDATAECAHAVRFSEEEAGARICTGIVDGQHWDCPTPPEHKVVAGRGRYLVSICLRRRYGGEKWTTQKKNSSRWFKMTIVGT